MICWGPSNLPTPSFGRDGRGTHLSISTTTSDSESEFGDDGPEPSSPQGHILPRPNLRIFTLAELRAATKNFRSDLLLSEGGFGRIYKGWIEEKSPNRNCGGSHGGSGLVVAIKKLYPASVWELEKEWRAEVDFLGRLSHPNLVKLLGYCSEDEELLLVYEYMQKGSLEHHLFRRGAKPLPWDTRLKILIGAARGFAFLHTPDTRVRFRDFKTSDILLDPSYNAKISYFGLIQRVPIQTEYPRCTSTYGLGAPEYLMEEVLNDKSDVFAFGVILLEMLTGLRAVDHGRPYGRVNLVNWIIPDLLNKRKLMGIMDSKLERKYPLAAAYQISQLALKCLQRNPKNRPSMEEVLKDLEKVDVSNVERHSEPKAQSARPSGQGP